jgi:hypothetical protein
LGQRTLGADYETFAHIGITKENFAFSITLGSIDFIDVQLTNGIEPRPNSLGRRFPASCASDELWRG